MNNGESNEWEYAMIDDSIKFPSLEKKPGDEYDNEPVEYTPRDMSSPKLEEV